jgi:hypothetical protein
MKPTVWGRPAWSFLHGMTLDPQAPASAKRAQKRLMEILCYILPCPTCQKSYRKFSQITLPLEKVDSKKIGDWVVEIHDCVNLKLDKPTASDPDPIQHWKNFQLKRFAREGYESYVEDMFFFLFTLAANYPLAWTRDTQVAEKYRDFFHTLPEAMAHRSWGRKMVPLTEEILSGGRELLMKWLYGMYLAQPMLVAKDRKQSFETISKTMEMMRHQRNT